MNRQTELAAETAARLIADNHLSWSQARARLARMLPPGAKMPQSSQIESALRSRLYLFEERHADLLRALRAEAADAMRGLRRLGIESWLTGAVLNGCATEDSNIQLECFSDDPKQIEILLFDAGCAWEAVNPMSAPGLHPLETLAWLRPISPMSDTARLLPRNRALAVTLDILPENERRLNPRKCEPDAMQRPAEAAGRISLPGLLELLGDDNAAGADTICNISHQF